METFNLVSGGNVYLNPMNVESVQEATDSNQALIKTVSGFNYLVSSKALAVADRLAGALAKLHGAG